MNKRCNCQVFTDDLWEDLVNNVSMHHGARTPSPNDIFVALTSVDKYIISKLMKLDGIILREVLEVLCEKLRLPIPVDPSSAGSSYIEAPQNYVGPSNLFIKIPQEVR